MKRIGIDARFYGPKTKGLGRYTQKLIKYLEEVDGGSGRIQYIIFLKKDNFDLYNPKHSNFKKVEADFDWYSFEEQFKFPFFINKFKLDLMHFCHFNVPILYRKKFLVTIHDLILFHYPTIKNTTLNKYFYFLKLLAYRLTIRNAARKSEKVIAVSEFTKKDIVKNLKVDNKKVEMIYEGCELSCFMSNEDDSEVLARYKIKSPYLLYVGNAYPHKNLKKLILAFGQLKNEQKDLSLVLVGGEDFFYRQLKDFVVKRKIKRVIFAGYVPDSELDILYKKAKLYVFPSLYEGFGLPPLEALAKFTPVISSSKTSMPEILENTAGYFDPESVESMVRAINKAIAKKENVSNRRKQNLIIKQLTKFNWRDMAKKTADVYEEISRGIKRK